jgi:D-alanyl-lipoteichoic acid acyltransferase DltB (MBOAT superfamily)
MKLKDIFYLLNLIVFLGLLYVISSQVRAKCHADSRCRRHLQLVNSPLRYPLITWPRYYTDTADGQWTMVRSSLGLLMLVIVSSRLSLVLLNTRVSLRQNIRTRLYHIISIGLGMIFVLHGFHSLIVFAIILVPLIVPAASRRDDSIAPLFAWGSALTILVLKESHRLVRYRRYQYLRPLFYGGGMYPWHYPVNLLSLRLISAIIDQSKTKSTLSYDETLFYLAYMLFPPLYISGPIITFKDFKNQISIAPLPTRIPRGNRPSYM